MPDALSRMYYGAYDKPESVWGTLTNIKFVEESFKSLSHSDKFCELSMNNMLKTTKQKINHKTGGGKNEVISDVDSDEENTSLPKIQFLAVEYETQAFYQFDENDEESQPSFTVEDEWDFEESIQNGPLCDAVRYAISSINK